MQHFCFVIVSKSFRILARTCVNDASKALAKSLTSNRRIKFLAGDSKRTTSILWHSSVSLFFTLILIVALSRRFSVSNRRSLIPSTQKQNPRRRGQALGKPWCPEGFVSHRNCRPRIVLSFSMERRYKFRGDFTRFFSIADGAAYAESMIGGHYKTALPLSNVFSLNKYWMRSIKA